MDTRFHNTAFVLLQTRVEIEFIRAEPSIWY
ncbi:hypothetical protein C497_01450 [Halalkalicoccus jeotgali B3]|uniref:Uncharacterized protein n=1 Tax=Halalkalicoccus jeotgali (strain DSM 18796 / CECT 7217 / JCM 14584 / KCTC 4019 / B3) TaxID=795797 RepID=D8JB68_HALJB|nr:hypothetical protein HacjB3_15806 [Halalkalicoccus jeotgali B3]ELY41384.1 hypothetical protein C497_01450 [Halalkalicoccus jeotgali B3]